MNAAAEVAAMAMAMLHLTHAAQALAPYVESEYVDAALSAIERAGGHIDRQSQRAAAEAMRANRRAS